MGRLLLGTSSWSEKSWVGSFYPDGTRPADMLAYYATVFSAVEADTTYYGVPRPTTVRNWAERTPDGFVMAAKFPRSIVHCGEGPRPDAGKVLVRDVVQADTDLFLDAMRLLGAKCGPLVLQFPFFNRDEFAGGGEFLERLDVYLGELPKEFRYGVELRNPRWIGEPLLHILRRHAAALVLVEMAYMPPPWDWDVKGDLATTDFVYARLIGDRKAVDRKTKTFDRLVLDKSDNLRRWGDLLSELGERVARTYVFANNHYAGHGPSTIRSVADRLAP